jgi:hypothetical protein
MKYAVKTLAAILFVFTLSACNNYFHDLIPPDDARILSFEVDGQMDVQIGENFVNVTVEKGTDVKSLLPRIGIARKASLFPITLDYVQAAFPSMNFTEAAMKMYNSTDIGYLTELIRETPDFNVPALDKPIDFSYPVIMLVVSGMGSVRQYAVNVVEDDGEPKLLSLRFSKYDNPELVKDALCMVNGQTVYASAVYPAEMSLSYALAPSFEILGDSFEVDGTAIVSGEGRIQFNPTPNSSQTKTITITRNGETKVYTLTIMFTEDKDSIRSITDFRFNAADNPGIAANAVGSIINTDNTGTITVQVFYNGAKPSTLTPRFISPGTVSVGGVTQTSGVTSHSFSPASPLEYLVVSKNGLYARTYKVTVELISITENTPRITAFTFSSLLNTELSQDAVGQISDGLILADLYYGGTTAPKDLIPEFSAEGLVTVSGSVQVSGASEQDFSRQIKYTVTNPKYPELKRDYWVQTRMIYDASFDAAIREFGFYKDKNPELADDLVAKIDQINGKINIYAPIGSGVTARTMIPRFTAAGMVKVGDAVQVSGVSGHKFDVTVTYTVVSGNGKNTRVYEVTVRELQTKIYVNGNAVGYGDGTSWENAFRSLKAACEAAALFPQDAPKEIWIAAGTYAPGTSPGEFLPLVPNTSYIGGFAGHEAAKSQRNVAANTVTISGDFGGGLRSTHLFYGYGSGDFLFEDLQLKDASGYGVYNSGFDSVINNCIISDNGGGVYVANGTFIMNGGTISGNTASYYGGGVCVNGGTFTMNDGTISNNTASAGGGVYVTNGTFTMNGGAISNNTASGGGGVCLSSGTFTMEGGAISNNTATSQGGGGVCVYGGTFTMNGGTISDNTATSQGGGVYVNGGTFTMDGGTISNNTATDSGGGVYVYTGGIITMNGGAISNNTAGGGGGVYAEGGTFTMNDGTISKNTATSYGGGVRVYGGTFTMESGEILNNTATSQGGGVSVNGIGTFTINGGTVWNNTASSGGGVYVSGGTFTMNGGSVLDNTAEWGGGVYLYSVTFTMNGGTIRDNTADNGGGAYVSIGTFTMNDGTISDNNATSNGGGVYLESGTFTMTKGSIACNTARHYGGGVFLHRGTFLKTGGTIYGNDGTANANMVKDESGTIVNGHGHAVYRFLDASYRDTTLGTTDNLSW